MNAVVHLAGRSHSRVSARVCARGTALTFYASIFVYMCIRLPARLTLGALLQVKLWDTETGACLQTYTSVHQENSNVTACAWLPDGQVRSAVTLLVQMIYCCVLKELHALVQGKVRHGSPASETCKLCHVRAHRAAAIFRFWTNVP